MVLSFLPHGRPAWHASRTVQIRLERVQALARAARTPHDRAAAINLLLDALAHDPENRVATGGNR